jgi:predicted RNA binding protein YcfA (HicA-like mRNA interferase family)
MKRGALLKALKQQGCVFVEHCKKHDRYLQPRTGITEQVPRHSDINEYLAKEIIKNLAL